MTQATEATPGIMTMQGVQARRRSQRRLLDKTPQCDHNDHNATSATREPIKAMKKASKPPIPPYPSHDDGSREEGKSTAAEGASTAPLDATLKLPKQVGSRELKTRLGSYLRFVRRGATFIVTDRGRPVAELRPIPMDENTLNEKLYELAAAGVVGQEISERRPLGPFEPIVTKGQSNASAAIIEDREDRF